MASSGTWKSRTKRLGEPSAARPSHTRDAPSDLWIQLEIGPELAEAVRLLGDLTAQACRVLTSSSG
ncbi:hypothetical protein C8D87_105313 [Lentzea atacamensis]|uniref:Uncharacterized protein n=1 Tax=Lentzea atacamensis TaxID=531938 RepID=A0ABX9E8L6_9PSEU|nr:hypothetical protein C8D87_105313 [Lentzea atacamensis]